MERSSNNGKQQAGGASAGKPARTHWRRRDPSATAVYVVHPNQFRDVVQQLTGVPASPATATRVHDQGNGGGTGTATAAASNNAAGQHRQQHEGGASKGEESSSRSRQRTLSEMHQECMAWANSDEYY